ncbi:hypothetical protein J6W20_04830 [bacterium]|nr:hypothetical protein [bacterium]
MQNASIQYQEGDIVLSNLMYNNASLQSVEITGFTSNNDLDIETMLTDFGASKLSNNLSNIYPLQYPLVGYDVASSIPNADGITTNQSTIVKSMQEFNLANLLANSYQCPDNPAFEPQVQYNTTKDGKTVYGITTFNYVKNIQF